MSQFAIRVENISKSFQIGQLQTNRTVREQLVQLARQLPRQFLRTFARKGPVVQNSIFWALRDVSFEVQQGEIVGIIGRNGAGKSTLLKILSKITLPTCGRVERYGRVGSLLEVGTGFHPELTGRENVYLNGAILGMKKAEIERKFDEIVAFAEVDQFLDTPVKHYSSGMYVRLAFAVAAHLEPEILIVDEVLAVGDTAFQQKCLGKMNEVAKGGRTVLVVSHNLGVVQALCNRAIVLESGSVLADDTAARAAAAYLHMLEGQATQDLAARTDRSGNGLIRLTGVDISIDEHSPPVVLSTGRPARFVFTVDRPRSGMSCAFTIYDQFGTPVTTFDSANAGREDAPLNAPRVVCRLDELSLLPGRYRIGVAIRWNGEYQDELESAAYFTVQQGEFGGRPAPNDTGYGHVLVHHRWGTANVDEMVE
jgi:lipopolysaccharide transport system ATP-binding protein